MTSRLIIPGGLLLASMLLLVACGGSGGSGNAARDPAPPPANNRPSISGVPVVQVASGASYEFIPSASDADGDRLTFVIVNQPSWVSFDTSTGALTGTPGEADIGTTPNVTISVSDGDLSASLDPFDLEVTAPFVGSATVSWDIPTTNADGSPLTDLAGFRVHYGNESGDYTQFIDVEGAAADSALIENLEQGTYYFAVTAIDMAGNPSEFSAEVSKVVQP